MNFQALADVMKIELIEGKTAEEVKTVPFYSFKFVSGFNICF